MRFVALFFVVMGLAPTGAAASAPCGTEACVLDAYGKLGEPTGSSPEVRAAVFPTFVAGCEAGIPGACHLAGDLLQAGVGVARDVPRALSFYDRACKGEIPLGCAVAAEIRLGTELSAEGLVAQGRAVVAACELARKKMDDRIFDICALFANVAERLDVRAAGHLAFARDMWDKLKFSHAIGRAYATRPHGNALRVYVRAHLSRVVCDGRALLKAELVGPACVELASLIRDDVRQIEYGRERTLDPLWTPDHAAGLEAEMCRLGVAAGCIAQIDAANKANSETPNHVGGTPAAVRMCEEEGNVEACDRVIEWHLRCDPKRAVVGGEAACDLTKAREGWQQRCEAGNQGACRVVTRLDRLRVETFEKLDGNKRQCLDGTLWACTNAGQAMPWGPERVAFFEEACRKGNVTGCLTVALALSHGEGVKKDHGRAAGLARELCREREYMTACDVFCGVYEGACPQ